MHRLRRILIPLFLVALMPWGSYAHAWPETGTTIPTASHPGRGAGIGDHEAPAVKAPATTPCRRANLPRSACAADAALIPALPSCPGHASAGALSIGPDWSFRDSPLPCPRSPPRPA